MRHHPRKATEVIRILATNWQIVLIGMMLTAMTTTTFYLITAYTPTFGSHALHLNEQQTLLVTLCIGASNFIWLPIGGWLSDRIGRRPVLFSVPALTLLTAYPAMLWLVAEPDFTKLLVVELLFVCYSTPSVSPP